MNLMNPIPHVINVTLANFQAEVVEKSKQKPVLLELYADEAEPSRALTPVLLRLAESFNGKFLLARVNIAEAQPLVQQLQVRTLPTLKLIVQGKIVQSLEGPQEEADLLKLLEQVTQSPMEQIRAEITLMVANGQREQAIDLLQQVIEEEPRNFALHAELCDLLIMVGRADEAEQILEALPKETEGINKPINRLEFLKQAQSLRSLEELTEVASKEPQNLQVRYDLAIRQIVDDNVAGALEVLIGILQADREFGEDIARKTMVKVFDLLGKGDALVTSYRRRMFALMH